MADDEKWGLSREEIDKRVRELNQKKKATGPTRGSRKAPRKTFLPDFSGTTPPAKADTAASANW